MRKICSCYQVKSFDNQALLSLGIIHFINVHKIVIHTLFTSYSTRRDKVFCALTQNDKIFATLPSRPCFPWKIPSQGV